VFELCLVTRSVAAAAVATGVVGLCVMETDNDNEVNVPKEQPPRASATVQAQASIRPTYHNTGGLPQGQPEGQAVQAPGLGEPVMSFGKHDNDNFATTNDETAHFCVSVPSPASGIGAPQESAIPSFKLPVAPLWQPLPEFGAAESRFSEPEAVGADQGPRHPRTCVPPPVSGAGAMRQRADLGNFPSNWAPAVAVIPQWQPTPVTTGGTLHAVEASRTTADQGNPRQLFATGSGSDARQQSLLGLDDPRHESWSSSGRHLERRPAEGEQLFY
jgi:hypothetical protein